MFERYLIKMDHLFLTVAYPARRADLPPRRFESQWLPSRPAGSIGATTPNTQYHSEALTCRNNTQCGH